MEMVAQGVMKDGFGQGKGREEGILVGQGE